ADVTNAGVSVGKYQISQAFIQTFITGLVYVIIVYIGARLILAGEGFSVGMLFAFLSFRQTFNERVIGFINQLVQFRLLGLHLDRLSDIVTAAPEADTVRMQSLEVEGAIKVRELSFRYGAADNFVLQDINLEVAPGDFVAITGPSGGGKTTLLKLMLGLHRATAGTIDLDGNRADAELWRALRTHLGGVAQGDPPPSRTISANIAVFAPAPPIAAG